MKKQFYFILFFPLFFWAQQDEVVQDSTMIEYMIIDGDSIPREAIDLEEVMILHKLKFSSKEDRRTYLILRRKTKKVYPYAKLAAERLESLTERLESLESKRQKRRYSRKIQKYIEGEFSDELKKLTKTEGQILIKLVHRQTGETTFNLVKNLRNGWRAFWFNNTAKLFNIDLKREYDPENVKEDYLIEDILQRNFQNGSLKRQKSVIDYDFYALTNKWINKK
ncbi:DUF4294 domain-containing protein [Lacinutrix sp. 5H-3-7-4]|uniref:DUF4294 domain-containing protein n=1 Tax=Lacinutrix sp. (strain 5H-3-7-4) TaxID=983544 RepID=UPI00020A33AA|nr:DUF4294 domain-containing protein [Lacinutrix sp. 5H-3-7-4]AEH02595.1 hypothetical protein Lacal_2756 [Lacinutrix sp. 5H-3-7-4]